MLQIQAEIQLCSAGEIKGSKGPEFSLSEWVRHTFFCRGLKSGGLAPGNYLGDDQKEAYGSREGEERKNIG